MDDDAEERARLEQAHAAAVAKALKTGRGLLPRNSSMPQKGGAYGFMTGFALSHHFASGHFGLTDWWLIVAMLAGSLLALLFALFLFDRCFVVDEGWERSPWDGFAPSREATRGYFKRRK